MEDKRLKKIEEHATNIGLNPHFARATLYSLIGESCKQQTIRLESDPQPDLETLQGEERAKILKANLIKLTERVAPHYDREYLTGHSATATSRRYEADILAKEIRKLRKRGIALDIGCGTGSLTIELARQFDKVIGYDLSQSMLYEAQTRQERENILNATFELIDVEEADLSTDNSASLAVMNLGTASDIQGIKIVLQKVSRALEPDGRFFLSFYNSDALVYKCDFLPWPVSLAAMVDPYTKCLHVQVKEDVFPVFAQKYSETEVRALLPKGLQIEEVRSYPLLASILPDDFFLSIPNPEVIHEIDRELANLSAKEGASNTLRLAGAYLIVCGRKIV